MSRPANTDKIESKRIQMDLAPKALSRLKRLQDTTEAASYAEVVRNALRLYEVLVEEHEKGANFKIEKNGNLADFHVF
jgi:dihydroxyacid dehydratase/phosphogluconate dehydratase